MTDAMTKNSSTSDDLTQDSSDVPLESDDFQYHSSEQKKSPHLSHRGLTIMLSFMCLVPVMTILVLWNYLPPVFEGQLKASVTAQDLPGADFYSIDYYNRPPVEGGEITIYNHSDVDWTHLNIQVNGNYQVYDTETIPAQGEKVYELSRFLNRTGARFSLQFNELERVRIYARRPTKDRATYYQNFETQNPIPERYVPVALLLGIFAVLLLVAAFIFVKLGAASATA